MAKVGILAGAFQGCNMKSIEIPASVTRIEFQAFCRCRSLEKVLFLGNRPQAASNIFAETPRLSYVYFISGKTDWEDNGIWQDKTTKVYSTKTLSSITISGNSSVNVGSTATYTCKATYSDGTSATVTPTWSISPGSSYATINSSGVLTDKAVGTVTVKASYSGKTATKSVTVNNPVSSDVVVNRSFSPSEETGVYFVEEKLSAEGALTVGNISDGGNYIADKNLIRWSFLDNAPRTLTYTVEPGDGFSGKVALNGEVMFNKETLAIEGDSEISFGSGISYELEDGAMILTFTDTLESSEDGINWTALDAVSPYRVTITDGKKFFRSVK